MCVVSMIYDWGRTVPDLDWTRKSIDDFRKMVEIGKELDESTGQKDCEDPEKTALLKRLEAIEQRLIALEHRDGTG